MMNDWSLIKNASHYCYFKKFIDLQIYIWEQFIYIKIYHENKRIREKKKSISINLLFLSSIYLLDNNMGCFHVFGKNS